MRLGAGFTVIEALVTLTVAGVLLAIAVPAFTQTVVSNRLTVSANALVSALSRARLQAIRRNATTQFCSNVAANNGTDAPGTSCGAAAGAIYVLEPAGTASLVAGAVLLSSDLALGDGSNGTTAVQALRYGASGLASAIGATVPYTGLVADLYSSRLKTDNHRCLYLTTGSAVSTCTYTTTTACPTSEPTPCQQP